jgi:hypothetical protein
MNQFQSIQSGQGELKDVYNNEPAKVALKRRRQRKFLDLGIINPQDIEDSDKKKVLEK